MSFVQQHLRMVEALLFAAAEPLDMASIQARLPNDLDVPAALEILEGIYRERGVNVVQVDSVPTNYCLTDDVTGEELQYGVTSVSKLP